MSRKAEILKAMNTLVMALNDEDAYYADWIYTVPDCATEEDLEEIADDKYDEIFRDAVKSFKRCMGERYLKSGFYIEGKVY